MAPLIRYLQSETLPVTLEVHIGRARRRARRAAHLLGLDRVPSERVALAATELASNLVRHGGGGLLIVRQIAHREREEQVGIELEARDEGPGIPDLAAALRDGFSTAGTLGSGLPGVQRLMDEFTISSAPGQGTRVIARLWSR